MNAARAGLRAALLCACLMSGAAAAVEVKLSGAWMHPAAAGAPSAMAYVDMQSDAPLELVGAATPVAQSVALVVVDSGGSKAAAQLPNSLPNSLPDSSAKALPGQSQAQPSADAAGRVVPTLALPANTLVRLAYRGDHLRLVNLRKAIGNGDIVPLTMRFRTAGGDIIQREVAIEVRGLAPPPINDGRGVGMPAPPQTEGPRLPPPLPTK